jgi:hypothetical protein
VSAFTLARRILSRQLYNEAGLKGTACGGASVSDLHANFLVYSHSADANGGGSREMEAGAALPHVVTHSISPCSREHPCAAFEGDSLTNTDVTLSPSMRA